MVMLWSPYAQREAGNPPVTNIGNTSLPHWRTCAQARRLVLANNKWHLPRLVGRELTGNKAAPTLPKKRAQVTGSWC